MPAWRAIDFANVFFILNFFSGRPQSNKFSGTTEQIFTNSSGIGTAM